MAKREVSGKTDDGVEQLRTEFAETSWADHYDFEDCFCLAKIPRQPEEYDGPRRYCASRNLLNNTGRCKYHGGAGGGDPSNLDKLANMKHGMNAKRENLVKDFSESDRELYDWIVEEWPAAYDVNLDDDPLAEYEFHVLACEVVRNERTAGYIIGEGEQNQKKVFGPDGSVHYEDIPHYLSEMLNRNRKLVMKMEDNLGISRKKRLQNEQAADATDVMKSFAEVGAALIGDNSDGYDPDRWGPDDS